MTADEAIAQLDAIQIDEVAGPIYGPRWAHEAADAIILAVVDQAVVDAYARVIDRCEWWAYA